MDTLSYQHWHDGLDPDVCVSVDGDAPGRLHLSHWPDNRTPKRFRHDVSTGMCLRLAEKKDRLEILEGLTTVTNNHWDTDGVCSAFCMTQPGLALAQAQHLVAAAVAGDFNVFSTPEGVKLDLTLTALTKHPDSPVSSKNFEDDLERRQAQYDHALSALPHLLARPDTHAGWFAQEFWQIQQDLRVLREEEAELERFDALDFAVVTHDKLLNERAVNTVAGCDRILEIRTTDSGARLYTFRLTTLSWFDLVSGPPRQRLDWQPLCDHLNNEATQGEGSWQADELTDPTPRLAFTGSNGQLVPNAQQPATIKQAVAEFLTQRPHLPAGL